MLFPMCYTISQELRIGPKPQGHGQDSHYLFFLVQDKMPTMCIKRVTQRMNATKNSTLKMRLDLD